jgi:O-antigen ligase
MQRLGMKSDSNLLIKLSFLTPLVVTIFATPLNSYDPINLPRFFILIICTSILLLLLFQNSRGLMDSQYRFLIQLSSAFIIWILISFFFSKSNLLESFFGVTGRQTGVLTYLAFIILMISAVFSGSIKFSNSLLIAVLISGGINAVYGLFQSFALDPFNWLNPYSPVFGLFGNPNFHASFMGITLTAAVATVLGKQASPKIKFILFFFIALAIYNIFESKSQQGYLVAATGISVVLFLWLRQSRYSILRKIYPLLWIIGGVGVVLDILQKAPWPSILYKESVSFRGDFWRAGWQMSLDNPVFGVGLDGYRDQYRFYRDQIAINRNSTAMVDSAHNVFLDISSGAGFPFLIIYLLLILYTLFSAVKVIRRMNNFEPLFGGIFGCWLAYLAQSLISINQIALAVWGWVIMGAIIGYEINTRVTDSKISIQRNKSSTGAAIIGAVLGAIIVAPAFLADIQFRSTVKSGDVIKIQQSVEKWPQSVIRMNLAAKILSEGGFPDQALDISTKAVEKFPRNFEAWQELALNPKVSEGLKAQALLEMKQLDPLNPNLS